MLSVGIVGLPNVGKSTLFNALTSGSAQVSNYAFTTIDSNQGVVAVPDKRLRRLEEALNPKECIPCHIEFIDIAGLVEGASRGEGLGNRFLGAIREVDAIAHVVRCFGGSKITHVFATVDPVRDAQIVETELLLADLQLLERSIEKREKIWKTEPRSSRNERERWLGWRDCLDKGRPIQALGLDPVESREAASLGLLTARKALYVANVGESEIGQGTSSQSVAELESWAATRGSESAVRVSAELEWELAQLGTEDRDEFVGELDIEDSSLDRLTERAFDLLGLVRFYTVAGGKLRAWDLEGGSRAPQAAGKVHSQMESGFIKAQVASCSQVLEHGSLQRLHALGLLRTEGKDYLVQDGDVMEFLFSS